MNRGRENDVKMFFFCVYPCEWIKGKKINNEGGKKIMMEEKKKRRKGIGKEIEINCVKKNKK